MVDHTDRQILQKLEDDALANARQAAHDKGQRERDEAILAETPNPEPSDEGLDETEIEAEEEGLTF